MMRLVSLFVVNTFLGILSLLSVGMLQVYFQTSSPGTVVNIHIGFPFGFYWFSTDGNGLHGSDLLNFCFDFLMFFGVYFVLVKI